MKTESEIKALLVKYENELADWVFRGEHAMWNSDGKGGHIQAGPQVKRCTAIINILKYILQ